MKQEFRRKSSNFFAVHRRMKKETEKKIFSVSLVHEAGLEPARTQCTLEPESSESANSTTRAFVCCSSKLLRYTNMQN